MRGAAGALAGLLALAGGAGFSAGAVGAAEGAVAARVAALTAAAEADCERFEGGAFSLAPEAITEVPVPGGETVVTVVDEGGFRCSTAASLWCGSGGCLLHLLAGDRALERQAEGWRWLDWGRVRVFLIGRDGGWCGGAGAQFCVEAVVWSGGAFLTLSDR